FSSGGPLFCPKLNLSRSARPPRNPPQKSERLNSSQRKQIFDEIFLFRIGQAGFEERVVVIDDVTQCCETAIVIEATLLMRPKPLERSCSVLSVRRTICLKVIDANFRPRMHVPAGFSE